MPTVLTYADDTKVMRRAFFCRKREKIEWSILQKELMYPFEKYVNNDGTPYPCMMPCDADAESVALYQARLFTLHIFVLYACRLTKFNYMPSDLQARRFDVHRRCRARTTVLHTSR